MIANARMYSVTPPVAALWRSLLGAILRGADDSIEIMDHAPPAPISELWQRPDKAAVFMCGLPYSLATPRPADRGSGFSAAITTRATPASSSHAEHDVTPLVRWPHGSRLT